MIDGLGAVGRDPQRRKVDRRRVGLLQNARQHGVGKIGAEVTVARCLVISSAHMIGRRRN